MILSEINQRKRRRTNPWFRGGKEILYFENHLLVNECSKWNYYTLTFKHKFEHSNDVVSFA